uniref:dUTP diphosphatase n=1 Tax=Marseillevirus LCMAC101 TaxID=2506602 RepID=A0A481YRS1_9VIRU|nr:MAG: dUTP diphosphatase [Marseillevirus LCMAC101]
MSFSDRPDVEVGIYNENYAQYFPSYASSGASGADIKAKLSEPLPIPGRSRRLVPTGIFLDIPIGYEVQIRPRSGLAFREGVHAILGTIDSDYRGEVKVLLMNNSDSDFVVENGMRIAQIVCSKVYVMVWNTLTKEELSQTERGEGGFGSTGIR